MPTPDSTLELSPEKQADGQSDVLAGDIFVVTLMGAVGVLMGCVVVLM